MEELYYGLEGVWNHGFVCCAVLDWMPLCLIHKFRAWLKWGRGRIGIYLLNLLLSELPLWLFCWICLYFCIYAVHAYCTLDPTASNFCQDCLDSWEKHRLSLGDRSSLFKLLLLICFDSSLPLLFRSNPSLFPFIEWSVIIYLYTRQDSFFIFEHQNLVSTSQSTHIQTIQTNSPRSKSRTRSSLKMAYPYHANQYTQQTPHPQAKSSSKASFISVISAAFAVGVCYLLYNQNLLDKRKAERNYQRQRRRRTHRRRYYHA